MNIFESINDTSGKMADAGETYAKKTQEYIKLKVFQQISVSISYISKALIIGGLLFIALFFLAFASALAIGQWLENLALGYLIVSLLFIILTVIVYYNRKFIDKKIIKRISTKFFDS
ncbi:phage holin family protein [Xanthomarina sp. F2636L]|uniref:phage holin family protein n=1 Tax=Xanthomarina sp. F2636L TaxID=2996018 RepID=UPI00225E1EA3|nr:phage holin family protein [Xanthomarina sp. F2636L]MCX7550067.1 phage holin family protein [Xanthomarina sp. F2636L]